MVILAEMSWPQIILSFLVIGVCLILMGVILLQRGRGMGLSGAFGGGGSSAFGAKTGDVFTWITVGVTGAFLVLVIIGNFLFDMSYTAKPKVVETTPAAPMAPSPIEMPALPPGGAGDGGAGSEPGSKRFPIRLEQVPKDPNDPSKGMTFQAVPVEGGEAGTAPASGGIMKPTPSPAPAASGASAPPSATSPAGTEKPSATPPGETKPAEPPKPEAEKTAPPDSGK